MAHSGIFPQVITSIGIALRNFFLDRLVDITNSTHFKPRIDVVEEGDVYHLKADMPGVDKQDLSVKIQKDVLSISGKRKLSLHRSEHLDHSEREYGKFSRSLKLSHHVDPTQVTAYFQNGILDIALKKSEREEVQAYTVDIY